MYTRRYQLVRPATITVAMPSRWQCDQRLCSRMPIHWDATYTEWPCPYVQPRQRLVEVAEDHLEAQETVVNTAELC